MISTPQIVQIYLQAAFSSLNYHKLENAFYRVVPLIFSRELSRNGVGCVAKFRKLPLCNDSTLNNFIWQRRAIGNSIVAIVVEVAVVLELRTIIAGRHLNSGTSIY